MLALYRTYRPRVFAEVTGQEHVTHTLQNQLLSGSVAHAYLLTGPRGIGKTTVARLLAKAVNCLNRDGAEPCNTCEACVAIMDGSALDVLEIDAASNTDVDNVRENIIRNVRFAPSVLQKKVFIIDEVHMLSTSSFNALLKTLEEPPAHALFILATTEIHKVPATILSRCQRFDFKKISPAAMVARLEGIVAQEKREVETNVLEAIAQLSGGSERDAESLLGQVLALDDGAIDLAIASLVLPVTTTETVSAFVEHLRARNAAEAIRAVHQLLEQGGDLGHFLDQAVSALRDVFLETVRTGGAAGERAFLNNAISRCLSARRHMKSDDIPQLPLELAIVEVCFGSAPTESAVLPPLSIPKPPTPARSVNHVPPPAPPVVKDEPQVILNPLVETLTTAPVLEGATIEPVVMAQESEGGETSVVFDSVPVIGIEDVRRKWPEVFAQIQECNASLPLFLQSCEVQGIGGDVVELAFAYDLYVHTVNKEKNRVLIESILERVLGKAVRIKAVLAAAKESDDLANSLADAFGGSVV